MNKTINFPILHCFLSFMFSALVFMPWHDINSSSTKKLSFRLVRSVSYLNLPSLVERVPPLLCLSSSSSGISPELFRCVYAQTYCNISVLQLNGLTAYDVLVLHHNIKGCNRFSLSGKW
ncbi:hypothetical protein VPH35_013106 [Triticum aestivum]|uniref:Uncharacterized protein n=1 Tax=Aegilops tauschii subsp. strangulata TaxID=200361 RepID=A0A452XVC7_AEGTS